VGLVVFFLVLMVTNVNAASGVLMRWGLLLLNALAVGLGLLLLLRSRKTLAQLRFLVPVAGLFVGLNGLAIVCNVVGRLSMAKMFSTTAIFGLTQGIGLAVFIELFTEAFHLQMLCSRGEEGGAAAFDYAKIEPQLMRLLTAVATVLWLMVFTSNLNMYGLVYGAFEHFLTATRVLGSTEFTFGNILLFFVILYVSALLQRYVGYFFGEVSDDDSAESRRRGSWLVALRLLMVLVGFALATAATGLPLSKIAIVFGALSVGIGLGLQSIVNNLVSGIILIFERPFQVGDFIEVAGKSGRVQDIGIRSSKLTSVTGSEIIVPNGDLLSGHVINWTRTNDHIRVDLVLKMAPGTDLQTDLQTARELIQEEIKSSPYTMQSLPPEILLSNVNGQVYELKILFWITNIRQEQLTKSEILAGIYRRFVEKGLTLS
jgi:small-conductance mechanosensitive channel